MAWLIRRVDTLPSVLTPSTIYFVDNGDDTASQYVTGRDGVARLTGGGASASVDWADLTGIPTSFPPAAHTQAFSTITATPTTLAGYGITDAATAAAGILAGTALQPGAQIPWTDVTGKPATFPPDAHTQGIATITGLQSALDGKATVAQGALADSALQPGDSLPWADVTGAPALFSGAYADLTSKPTLGTAAAQDATAFATAAQGALAATASQPGHTHAQGDVTGLVGTLAGKAAAVHGHAIADVTELQGALDGKQPLSAVLTATTASFTTADEIKLDGIETGATVNSTDATLLARANHTGTQAQGTVDGLVADLAAKQAALVSGTNIKTVNGNSLLESGDLVIAGGGGSTQVYVQDTDPGLTGPGVWIQTGLAPDGAGFTFWFEDGL